jgi:hypothetical protein
VTFAQTGTVSLSWNPPTKNTDGSSLTNLASTKVYWGPAPSTLSSSTIINNPSAASYVVTGLNPGTWFFAVSAVNAAGAESSLSNVVQKSIAGSGPVTIAGPVFSIQTTDNSMVNPQLGTIAAGKPCDQAQGAIFGGKTYLRVNVADASLFAGVDTAGLMLVAACQ